MGTTKRECPGRCHSAQHTRCIDGGSLADACRYQPKTLNPSSLFRDILNTMLDAVHPYACFQQTWQPREPRITIHPTIVSSSTQWSELPSSAEWLELPYVRSHKYGESGIAQPLKLNNKFKHPPHQSWRRRSQANSLVLTVDCYQAAGFLLVLPLNLVPPGRRRTPHWTTADSG